MAVPIPLDPNEYIAKIYFYQHFFPGIECGLPKEKALEKKQKLLKNFIDGVKKRDIPHIHHRVWITNQSSPVEAPSEVMDRYLASVSRFAEDWEHIFWCQNPRKIPKTIARLGDKIKIKNVEELIHQNGLTKFYTKLLRHRMFTFASNIARIAAVYNFGGLYCDLGVEWMVSPEEVTDRVDRLVYYNFYPNNEIYLDPDKPMFAAPPQHKAEAKFLSVFRQFLSFPASVRAGYVEGFDLIKLLGSPIFLACLDSEMDDDESIVYLNDPAFLVRSHLQSWHVNTKSYGNQDVKNIKWR